MFTTATPTKLASCVKDVDIDPMFNEIWPLEEWNMPRDSTVAGDVEQPFEPAIDCHRHQKKRQSQVAS